MQEPLPRAGKCKNEKKNDKNISAMQGQIQDLLVFSSVLFQHLVILHRPYPLSCQYRHTADFSVDMSTDISVECLSICQPLNRQSVDRYVHRYIGRRVHKMHMFQNTQRLEPIHQWRQMNYFVFEVIY